MFIYEFQIIAFSYKKDYTFKKLQKRDFYAHAYILGIFFYRKFHTP